MKDDIAKILFWDTEITPLLLVKFDLKPEYVRPANIVQDFFFISAQWGWAGDDKVYDTNILDDPKRFAANHTDDYHVIKTIHDVLNEADIVVAHNGDGFDMPKFLDRCSYHKLKPLKQLQFVDTLKEARRIGYTSRSLAYLCEHLSLTRKLENDYGAFKLAALGDKKAIKNIVEYGRGDIPTLKDLYYRLLPFMKSHPNLNLYREDGEQGCPHCGSTHFIKKEKVYLKSGVYQGYMCKETKCGKRFRGKTRIKSVEMMP